MNNWVKIFSSSQTIEAEMVKDLLIGNGIQAALVNKIDSSYLSFGQADVYCLANDVILAKQLLEKLKNNHE
jgi:sulfur transfer complex TusBCD TusB component (DsrH family)